VSSAAGRDDLANERLSRHDADQALSVRDEDRPHLGLGEQAAGLDGERGGGERSRLGHHRVANAIG